MASTPHNKERYGELWPQGRIDTSLAELHSIKEYATISGGWAWHFLSGPDHIEYKHAHDHKDIDIFVKPNLVGTVVSILKSRGFERVRTKYDTIPSVEDFRRYEKRSADTTGSDWRITIDFFVGDHPSREIDGWQIIEPSVLLGFYSNIHTSDKCFAVQAAAKLLADGIDPQNHPSLNAIPNVNPVA